MDDRNPKNWDALSGASRPSVRGESPVAARVPEPREVLNAALHLARSVDLELDLGEIVRLHLEAFERLMPSRHFSVRTISFAATGDLVVHGADAAVKRSSAVHTESAIVATSSLDSGSEELDECTRSDIPLLDGESIIGVLAVEYDSGVSVPAGDALVLGQLAAVLTAALRNARKLRSAAQAYEQMRGLLRSASLPILVLGPHRRILLASQGFLDGAGLFELDVVGKDLLELAPAGHRSELRSELSVLERSGGAGELSLVLQGAPASRDHVPMCVNALLNADGGLEAMLAIGWDRSEVQQLERQVIQAEKLATLGQLAAGVVHELNNPLTSISVYSDFLLNRAEARGFEPDDVEKLRRIGRSGERILRFTRDLVAYARPAHEEPRSADLREIVDQAMVFCEHVIAEVGATVSKRYEPGLGFYGNPGQLHQVFINLITNACQAVPEGAGRLEIALERIDDEHVVGRVKDNGAGIAPDIRESIFEPFFSTKGEGKGTGLGLSIVRKIVEQHRGRVTIESRIGEGATFSVILPSRRAH